MYKPLKKRNMSSHSGPLRKMINDEVEKRMSALKATEGQGDTNPVWGEFAEKSRRMLEDGRTEITEARTGTMPGDNYDGTGGYAPDDQWLAFLETPEGEEYTKNTAPREVEEERLRFLEAVPEAIEPRTVDEIDPVEQQEEQKPSYLQTPVGQQSIMELFNVNPEQGGNLTNNAKNFFDTSFSTDNPVLDVLKDDKYMKKARKAYNKENFSSKQKATMPFERYVMQTYKGGLSSQAKQWEGDNAQDTDTSQFQNPDGTDAMNREIDSSKDAAVSRRVESNPFDRYIEQQKKQKTESSDQPSPENTVGQFKMNRNTSSKGQSKMIKAFGKPMSFRNNKH